jgi:hypothetical protein
VLFTYDDVKYGVYAKTTSGLSGNEPIVYIVGVYGEDKARDRTALWISSLLLRGRWRGVIEAHRGAWCYSGQRRKGL